MFADTATIEVRAGKGGDGLSSFLHEKYRAKGGPDGGDGGRGGSVIFEVDHNLNTLSHYRTARIVRAGDGAPGRGNRQHGRSAADEIIPMPQGTQIYEGDELLVDLNQPDSRQVIARGGRGGFGNAHFKSSTRQIPRTAELGEPGEVRQLRLELKLVADAGLVGLPNAGKSTLLSVTSAAKPVIADYPFTTLVPNLGVVDHKGDTFLVADIPGLIEGASEGKGLGDQFLRHIERTAMIVQLVDAHSADPVADWCTVDDELRAYDPALAARPRVNVLSKIDGLTDDDIERKRSAIEQNSGERTFAISAAARVGLSPLLDAVLARVLEARTERAQAAAEEAVPVIDSVPSPDFWRVEPAGAGAWRLHGERLEGFARRTNFDQPDAVERLRDILRRTGVDRELRRQKAADGDILHIGGSELEWQA